MTDTENRHLRLLEALLFASAEPLSERALAGRLPEEAEVGALLETLQGDYAERGVNLIRVGRSWAFRTAPDLSQQLNMAREVPRKLSRAAVETMAIVAYHQPVTRAEIEEIRGVSLSRGTLDVLLEAGWIKPRGRRQVPGRPMTWGTTDGFLDHFGLNDIRDLPGMDELKAAGLLDSGPAISAYRVSGEHAEGSEGNGADANGEGDEAELPLGLADDETEGGVDNGTEPPEPLDPLDAEEAGEPSP